LYVLTDGEKFLGQLWETFNNSPRRPRYALRALNDSVEFRPILCLGSEPAEAEIQRALEIQGLHLHAVPVSFQGQGKKATIEVRNQ
jgi:hypothetical protein